MPQHRASTGQKTLAFLGVRNALRVKFSTFHASLRRIARSVVGKSFVFLELEDGGSVAKVLPLAFEAVELEWAQAWRGKRRAGRAGDSGLGAALEMTSASRIEKRLRRQEVSASSYTSWVSVGVFGSYSAWNWQRCCSYATGSSEGGRLCGRSRDCGCWDVIDVRQEGVWVFTACLSEDHAQARNELQEANGRWAPHREKAPAPTDARRPT